LDWVLDRSDELDETIENYLASKETSPSPTP